MGLEGQIAVCRECLVDGPIAADKLDDFWKTRREFLIDAFGDSKLRYDEDVRAEFEKLLDLKAGSELNLWFEYELFCQVNLWFTLSLLTNSAATIFRVAPVVRPESDKWKGFGKLDAKDLRECFDARVKLDPGDIRHGAGLWEAYRSNDRAGIKELAIDSPGLPMLSEVAPAAVNIADGPKMILHQIIDDGFSGPESIFGEFSRRAGVYGFGDEQVFRLLASVQPK